MCHQTVSLVARHLEANGLPTVILGSALDIVERCGAPRFAFTDFPLGNPCGQPYDRAMQRETVAAALALFEQAGAPRTTLRLPARWQGNEQWRESYMAFGEADLAELRRMGDERRAERQQRRESGLVRAV